MHVQLEADSEAANTEPADLPHLFEPEPYSRLRHPIRYLNDRLWKWLHTDDGYHDENGHIDH